MTYHVLGPDGSFTCGDSVTGVTSYAYPTSEHANAAKKNPDKVAAEMLANEKSWSRNFVHTSDYDQRNWERLKDVM